MDAIETRFHRALAVKISDELTAKKEQLATGIAADHGEYLKACGYIKGLAVAAAFAEEIATKENKRDNRGEF
jgi:hypothetical protein